jgi:hypothetical protein
MSATGGLYDGGIRASPLHPIARLDMIIENRSTQARAELSSAGRSEMLITFGSGAYAD